MNDPPASTEMPPLRIIAHWPPILRRLTPTISCTSPADDRPGAPHAQHRGDTGRAGDAQPDGGEQADRDVHVQPRSAARCPRRPDVDDGRGDVEQRVQHEQRDA